jgi:hypothetical protein
VCNAIFELMHVIIVHTLSCKKNRLKSVTTTAKECSTTAVRTTEHNSNAQQSLQFKWCRIMLKAEMYIPDKSNAFYTEVIHKFKKSITYLTII